MVDVLRQSGALDPQGPKYLSTVPENRVSSATIAAPYTAIGAALGDSGRTIATVGAGVDKVLDEAAIPDQQEAGRNAVTKDANGNVQFEAIPLPLQASERAFNAAGRQAAFAMAKTDSDRATMDARVQFDGDPEGFDAWAKSFVAKVGAGASPFLKPLLQEDARSTVTSYRNNLVAAKHARDVDVAEKTLTSRRDLVESQLNDLAFQGAAGTSEYERLAGERVDLQRQMAANPLFKYGEGQRAADDTAFDSTNRAQVIIGAARRQYEQTGDLAGTLSQTEKALNEVPMAPEKRLTLLGRLNSHMAGAQVVHAQKVEDLVEQSRAMQIELQLGGKVDEAKFQDTVTSLRANRRVAEARTLQISRQQVEGATEVRMATNPDAKIAALTGPRTSTNPLDVARQYEGLTEGADHATLREFFVKCAGQNIDPRKVPWCAAFADAVLGQAGKATLGSLRAADFLKYGTATEAPSKGDVVVFKSLAAGSSGHVGIVIGIENGRVKYIGGNDASKVQESSLPLSSVAGFRVPPQAGEPIPGVTVNVPEDRARRSQVVSYASTSLLSLSYRKAAQEQFNTDARESFAKIRGVLDAGSGIRPSEAAMADFNKLIPHVTDPALRTEIADRLDRAKTELAAAGRPVTDLEAASTILRAKVSATGATPTEVVSLKALDDAAKAQREALKTNPYRATAKLADFPDEPRQIAIQAAIQPDYASPEALQISFMSRATTSRFVESREGLAASSLVPDEEGGAFAGAMEQGGPREIKGFFRALASVRPENGAATLANSKVGDALKKLARTEDPQRYLAVMGGLSAMKERDPQGFVDSLGQDMLERVHRFEIEADFAKPDLLAKQLQERNRGPGLSEDVRRRWSSAADKASAEVTPDELLKVAKKASPGLFLGKVAPETPSVTREMMGDFAAILRQKTIDANGDVDAAKPKAIEQLLTTWSVSPTNNGRFMKFAPERYLTDAQRRPLTIGGSFEWVGRQIQDQLNEIARPRDTAAIREAEGVSGQTIDPGPVDYELVAYSNTRKAIAAGQPAPYIVIYKDPRTSELMQMEFTPDVDKAMITSGRRARTEAAQAEAAKKAERSDRIMRGWEDIAAGKRNPQASP